MKEQVPQNINKKEKTKDKEKKVETEKPSNFLEIGSGSITFLDRDKLKEGDNYYIVEISEYALKNLKGILYFEKKLKKRKNKYNIFTILGDGGNLPFEDKKMDKVFLSNVFGDPRISYKKKEEIIREAKRVLKDEGIIIVKENIYPMNIDSLIDLLKKKGLYVEKKVDMLQEWKKEISLYQSDYHLSKFSINSYMLFLKKELK